MAGAGSPRGHWASLDDCGGADPGAAHSNCPSSFSYQSVCALREENKKNNLFLSILLHWFGQCHSFQRSIYTGLRRKVQRFNIWACKQKQRGKRHAHSVHANWISSTSSTPIVVTCSFIYIRPSTHPQLVWCAFSFN